jgi:starch-binding outer membrane protein, SusD/RagB family
MKCLKNKCIGFVVALSVFTTTACKKLVHVDEPDDSLTSAVVFSNDSLAQAAVVGLYIKIMNNTKFLLSGAMSVYPSMSADELIRFAPMANEEEFSNNAIVPTNQYINVNIWKAAYTYIYHCNICIEGLNRSTGVSITLKNRLSGEMKFMRALCYYYLVNLYGDVPLALGTNADVNSMLSRTRVEQVYKQIETDLIDASNTLTEVNGNTLPTVYAAKALLARIYLHLNEWNKAEQMADAVINSGQFSLQTDLNNVFISSSREVIFQLAPVQSRSNAPEGFLFLPLGSSRPNYKLSSELLNAFESGDLRRGNWVKLGTFSGQQYNYSNKYKVNLSPIGHTPTEYNVILRLAEQYLIRAEARAWQNRIEEAISDINIIHTRAGLPALEKNLNNDQCLEAIAKERRLEFFTEWGHRWIDLKRTRQAHVVLSRIKANWQDNDALYPIPFSELETAPNLEQNPGYE